MKIFSQLSQRVAVYLKPLNRKWKRQVSCEIVDILWKLSSFVKYCFAAFDLTDSSTQDITRGSTCFISSVFAACMLHMMNLFISTHPARRFITICSQESIHILYLDDFILSKLWG